MGRKKTLPFVGLHLARENNWEFSINMDKYALFLIEIQKGYYESVEYHNDLHGADVAQMAHLILRFGGLGILCDLDWVDTLGLVVGGLCHDFGHDGYNNAFHVNALTDRAIRYNDLAV